MRTAMYVLAALLFARLLVVVMVADVGSQND